MLGVGGCLGVAIPAEAAHLGVWRDEFRAVRALLALGGATAEDPADRPHGALLGWLIDAGSAVVGQTTRLRLSGAVGSSLDLARESNYSPQLSCVLLHGCAHTCIPCPLQCPIGMTGLQCGLGTLEVGGCHGARVGLRLRIYAGDMSARLTTVIVGSIGLVVAFAVAQGTGIRLLGGIVLLAVGAWCAIRWWRACGVARAALAVLGYGIAFVVSHPFGHVVGAWPSVVIVAVAAGLVGYALTSPR